MPTRRSFLNTASTSTVAHTGAFLLHSCCRQSPIDAASFCELSQASAKLFVASRRAFSSSNTSPSGAPSLVESLLAGAGVEQVLPITRVKRRKHPPTQAKALGAVREHRHLSSGSTATAIVPVPATFVTRRISMLRKKARLPCPGRVRVAE